MPRDFDPAIGDCLGVYLYSIDDLEQACQPQPTGTRERIAGGAARLSSKKRPASWPT